MPRAFEFRTFWWDGQFVAITPYWTDVEYKMTAAEQREAIDIGSEAARRVKVKFLAVDIAMTHSGLDCDRVQRWTRQWLSCCRTFPALAKGARLGTGLKGSPPMWAASFSETLNRSL